jgi:hypothetical protein
MAVTCALVALGCPLCRSPLVKVTCDGDEDLVVCPVCWASASHADASADINALKRGNRIDPKIKHLVDQARFPRPPGDMPA